MFYLVIFQPSWKAKNSRFLEPEFNWASPCNLNSPFVICYHWQAFLLPQSLCKLKMHKRSWVHTSKSTAHGYRSGWWWAADVSAVSPMFALYNLQYFVPYVHLRRKIRWALQALKSSYVQGRVVYSKTSWNSHKTQPYAYSFWRRIFSTQENMKVCL